MNDCKTRKITAAEYAVEKIDNEGHKILAHFPDNGNGEKEAEEYRQMLVLFDHYGGFAEVERKLKILDGLPRDIENSLAVNRSAENLRIYLQSLKSVITGPKQTTVGDLKPGGYNRVRIEPFTRKGDNVYLRPKSCESIDSVIKCDSVVMMYVKNNSLCLWHKLTPCVKVEDE